MTRALGVLLLALMAGFGWAVYHLLGASRGGAAATHTVALDRTRPLVKLPGTLVVAQGGALYRLQAGAFTELAAGDWTQPAVDPAHTQLVAVKRSANLSDLYVLGLDGGILRQITQNASPTTQLNHWSFYPRFGADGRAVFYSYDPKDVLNDYRVDLAIYAQPLAGGQAQARRWTLPHHYTGGDVEPVPLPSGGLLYAKYNLDDAGNDLSQLWLQSGPEDAGRPLTAAADDCSQPALSPDGRRLAMICTGNTQVARLEVAPFDGGRPGPAQVLAAGLVASPQWAPDGSGLVYLAAAGSGGHFQIFYEPRAAPAARAAAGTASPAPPAPPPQQVTTNGDLDAASPPVWY